MKKFWTIVIALLAALSGWAETLAVHTTTEGPRTGTIDVLVFTSDKGFPNNPEQAFRRVRIPVTAEGPVECTITNLPYGEYSLSVLHDVNNNYKADKLLGFGPPKEPIGFSNVPEKLRKKPHFENTLFTFSAEETEQTVNLFRVL